MLFQYVFVPFGTLFQYHTQQKVAYDIECKSRKVFLFHKTFFWKYFIFFLPLFIFEVYYRYSRLIFFFNIVMELSIIQSKIYEIRDVKIILDFDLATLYQVETKYLKRSVKRNIERFPHDFMFELSKDEWSFLRCNFGTSSWGGIRYLPFAFTQEGVAMLSGILNSQIAIQVNITIMRAFVAIRQLITNPTPIKELQDDVRQLKQYIEDVFADYNDINEDTRMELELINQTLAELQSMNKWLDKPRNPIGFIQPQK